MAGLATQGFQLSQLPPMPVVPENIGKIDVKAIYDRVTQGLQTANALSQNMQQQATEGEQLRAQQAQAQATQRVLPSQTQAEINKSNVLAQANNPNVAELTGNVDTAKLKTLLADTEFQNTLTPQQRQIFAQKGIPTATSSTVQRNPDNTTVAKTVTGAALPGADPVTTGVDTVTTPTTPVITPIPGGPGGTPLGAIVSNTGLGGKTNTEIVHTPFSALNSIPVGSQKVVVGVRKDDQGNSKEVVQVMQQGAAGGVPHPVGAPYEIVAGSDSTVIRPGGATAPQGGVSPFISKDASKAIEDAQAEVQVLQQRKAELQNINNAAEQYIGSSAGAGKFTGPIRAFLGDPKAQEFTGSVQNALQTALQPLRGTGRVSQTEFNQALSALPTINDQAETIRAKLGYLNFVTDWAQARQQSILDNLGQGLNRYQAFQAAMKSTPFPEAPNFAAGETGVYTPPAQGAQPQANAAPAATSQPHPQDAQAIQYAKTHPEDPRSAAILKANGL